MEEKEIRSIKIKEMIKSLKSQVLTSIKLDSNPLKSYYRNLLFMDVNYDEILNLKTEMT